MVNWTNLGLATIIALLTALLLIRSENWPTE